ncbi:MAG: hypothetical protein SV186_05590 [Candidatus Nanohaloarchaea archaeon]|nr:hypothetical protein [Candidatus Nanohaloarchaea archaeon]
MRTTELSELEKTVDGDGAVEVGFRPSGELHIGNLVSIASAALIAARNDMKLQVTCCDTDWAAHTHELVREDNKQIMKHYFEREDPDGCHEDLAKHRFELARPYIEAIIEEAAVDAEIEFMSELQKDPAFRESLKRLHERMPEFDAVWDGGFRRRWKSPVAPVCDCGFSPAKGAAYAPDSESMVFPCWAEDCDRGYHEADLDGDNMLGIYYLVDPIRDTSSRDTEVHVFGGDYRKAEKGQKTSKIYKVSEITMIANRETPDYFLAPLIVSTEGKPLSKSKGTGVFLSELDEPEAFVSPFMEEVAAVLRHGENAVVVSDLVP